MFTFYIPVCDILGVQASPLNLRHSPRVAPLSPASRQIHDIVSIHINCVGRIKSKPSTYFDPCWSICGNLKFRKPGTQPALQNIFPTCHPVASFCSITFFQKGLESRKGKAKWSAANQYSLIACSINSWRIQKMCHLICHEWFTQHAPTLPLLNFVRIRMWCHL